MEAFKNRNIFGRWMAKRRGILKGAHLLVAPLESVLSCLSCRHKKDSPRRASPFGMQYKKIRGLPEGWRAVDDRPYEKSRRVYVGTLFPGRPKRFDKGFAI